MINLENVRNAIKAFDASWQQMHKFAMVPGPAGPPPQAGGPPPGGDPNAMPPGAMPPGGAPPPGMDPNAMPPGGAPPMGPDGQPMPPGGDPNAMPPGGDPNAMPPGGDPNAQGGGMPPEAEAALSQLADGMGQVAQTVEQQQEATAQMSKRMLDLEQRLDAKEKEDKLKESAPFEGSTRNGKSISLKSIAGL